MCIDSSCTLSRYTQANLDILRLMRHLRYLDLSGNPLAEETGYRLLVIKSLPWLETLDMHKVHRLGFVWPKKHAWDKDGVYVILWSLSTTVSQKTYAAAYRTTGRSESRQLTHTHTLNRWTVGVFAINPMLADGKRAQFERKLDMGKERLTTLKYV